MAQESYTLEIVGELIKAERHVRDLAKILGTNHMTILRRLKQLYALNVVDFITKGKNNFYLLNKTIEARIYIFMSEHYKLIKLLRENPHLRKSISNIQGDKRIKLAILFGSYAKGIAKKDSDVDIYIETTNRNIKQELELIDSKLNIKIGKYDAVNLLIKEIEKNHIILKGVEGYYERNNFFG